MESKIIRIAQVIGAAGTGGVESCIMNYYKHIDKTKVQFDFFVESDSKIIDREKIESMGGKIVIIPPYTKFFKYIKELKRLFKEGKYDIVHSNMNALSVFTLYAAKKAGIKIRIAHSHSTTNKKEWKKNLIKKLLRPFSKTYSTHYFACSELAGKWLFGEKTLRNNEIYIVNNAIDVDRFAYNERVRNSTRESYGLCNKIVIGHIGRFMTQKNHRFLIEIFNEYQKLQENSVLLLIGEGSLIDEIKIKVKEFNIEDKVIFAGTHTNPEIFYQAMDCFVLPSLYEGLPVVGVEAQANSLPCVFADTITKEVIINKNVRIKSLNESALEWAKEIKKILEDSTRELSFEFANSKYNIKLEAQRLLSKYQSLITDKMA